MSFTQIPCLNIYTKLLLQVCIIQSVNNYNPNQGQSLDLRTLDTKTQNIHIINNVNKSYIVSQKKGINIITQIDWSATKSVINCTFFEKLPENKKFTLL